MESIVERAAKGGFVFGVCNGFQILWKQVYYLELYYTITNVSSFAKYIY